MKPAIILLVLVFSMINSFGQQINKTPQLLKQDYLQKSKKQKTKGWILLSAATAFLATAVAIPEGELTGYTPNFYEIHENDNIIGVFFVAGLVFGIASFPFFVSAGKNKKRAANASASLQIGDGHMMCVTKPVPSISLRVDF